MKAFRILLFMMLAASLQAATVILDPRITGSASQVASGTFTIKSGATLTVESGVTLNFGTPIPLSAGGLGVGLSDPGADRLPFWDDSAGSVAWLTIGDGLGVSGTTLSATITSAAPVAAKYIVQTADGTLTNEQALSALSTGILKNTTSTGVLSIAVDGTDFLGVPGSSAEGDILFRNSSVWTRLPRGSTGQVLTATASTINWASPGTGAPGDATYITATANGTLSNEFALGSLATGILKNTTGTGIPTIASAGVDFLGVPGGSDEGDILYRSGTTWTRFPRGSTGSVLQSTSTSIQWSSSAPAPAAATFITQTPDADLDNEQALSLLSTGLLKVTTGTGLLSNASAGVDFLDVPSGSTEGDLLMRNGSGWTRIARGSTGQVLTATASTINWAAATGGAPSSAKYITQTADGTLSDEQALSSLATGIVQVTTSTGVLSSVTTSAGVAGLLSDETGSGAAVFGTSPTITTPTISGAVTFPSGVRQTFAPNGSNSGLNVGSVAGNPSSPSDGDVWYNSSGNQLTARINGSNVALGSGGGGGSVATDTIWDAAGDLVVGTGSNTGARLAAGSNGDVLTISAGVPAWAAPSSGSSGTLTLARFTASDNHPPASNWATFDVRNSIGVLDFDDTTAESAVFVGIIPEGANFSTGISVRIKFMATSATSGDVIWTSAFEQCTTDLDSDSFATGVDSSATTTSGTSGIPTTVTINHSGSQIDSLAAGDLFRVKITRKAADGSDTMSGDAELIAVEIRQR